MTYFSRSDSPRVIFVKYAQSFNKLLSGDLFGFLFLGKEDRQKFFKLDASVTYKTWQV